eukprot:6112069-Pyramimonas_sp.AAC.1
MVERIPSRRFFACCARCIFRAAERPRNFQAALCFALGGAVNRSCRGAIVEVTPSSAVRGRRARRALRPIARGAVRESVGRARRTARKLFLDCRIFQKTLPVFWRKRFLKFSKTSPEILMKKSSGGWNAPAAQDV